MLADERELILEEEWLMVRDSGEIPEIALHSTLDYLCHDEEGPRFILTSEEMSGLHTAVLQRYVEIILRDLSPSNRSLSLYRGVARAIINWRRLRKFCRGVQLDYSPYIEQVSEAVLHLIRTECAERERGRQEVSGFNCNAEDLCAFLDSMNISTHHLPANWSKLCDDPPNHS